MLNKRMLFSCVMFFGASLYLSGETLKSKNENNPTKEKKVREQLAQVVKKIDLEDARLDESLKVVCKGTGIKLYIDWKELKKKTKFDFAQCLVRVHMSNVTRGKLISYVLRSAGGIGTMQPEYIVEKDGIRITPQHIMEQPTFERQYDVSDVVRILGKTKARKQLENLFFTLDLWPTPVSPDVPLYHWQGTKITVAGDLFFHKDFETLLDWLHYPILPDGKSKGKGKEKQQLVSREKRLLKKLDAKCKTAVNKSMQLRRAMEFFRKESGINVFVDWSSLLCCGVKSTHAVKLNTAGLKLSQILNQILDVDKKNGESLLDFRLDGNILVIESRDVSNGRFLLRAYDIGDLIINKRTQKVSSRPARPDPVRTKKIITKIRKLIIGPVSKKQNEFASKPIVDVYGDRLLVFHNWRSHQKVVKFLDNLRPSLPKTPAKMKSTK